MKRNEQPNVTPIRRGHAYNESTGEVYPVEVEAEAEKPKRRRRKQGERKVFALIDNNVFARIELTGLQWRILFQLIAAIHPNTGESRITQTEMAQTLGIAIPGVSRALSDMQERNIVFKLGNGRYRVNSWLAFRGEVRDWDDQTDKDPEPTYERSHA